MSAARLTTPSGCTAAQASAAAVRVAGAVAGAGGGSADLAWLLRAAGLLHDPEQRSGKQLAHPQSHPYGERFR